MFTWYIDGNRVPYNEPAARRGISAVSRVDSLRPVSGVDPANAPVESVPGQGSPDPYTRPENKPRAPALTIAQIMTSPVRVVQSNLPLHLVQEFFSLHRYRHAPVVNQSGALCGVVSDRDLLRVLAAGNPRETPISAWMKSKVLTAVPETEIRTAVRTMLENSIGCLPVLDEGAAIVGIVTTSDVLRTVVNNVPLELWI